MKLEFQLAEDEYLLAQNVHCEQRTKIKGTSPLVSAGAGVIFALAGILFALSGATGLQWCGYFLVLVGAYLLVVTPILRRRLRRGYKAYRLLQQTFSCEIDEDGIRHQSALATSQTDWNSYTSFVESKDLFLLYLSPDVFTVIPKRAIPSNDIDAFRDLLVRKVPIKK